MKIAIIVNSLQKKGPVIVGVSLALEFEKLGHDVTLFYIKNTKQEINTHNLNIQKINIIKLLKFDIIHSHSILPDIINGFISIFHKEKTITTIHNNIFTDLNEYNFFKRITLKYLWLVSWFFIKKKVCLTNTLLSQYNTVKFKKSGHWTFIYNPVNIISNEKISSVDLLNINKIKDRKKTQRIAIGTCAVITKRKGIQYLIAAANQLKHNFDIYIIGDGNYKNTLEAISHNQKSKNIYFYPSTTSPRAYMQAFDIYIMPSISEGFGLAAVESIFENCTLICSNIDTFHELFEDKIGYWNIQDNYELVNMLDNINITDKESESKNYFLKKFSPTQIAKKYIDEYKK